MPCNHAATSDGCQPCWEAASGGVVLRCELLLAASRSSRHVGMNFHPRGALSATCGFPVLDCIGSGRCSGAHLCLQHDSSPEPGSGSSCPPSYHLEAEGKIKSSIFFTVFSLHLSLLNCIPESYWSSGWVITRQRWKQSCANLREKCLPMCRTEFPQHRETPITP